MPKNKLALVTLSCSFFWGCSGPSVFQRGDHGPSRTVNVAHIPDAVPKVEPKSKGGNKSTYTVFGKNYSVMPSSKGYVERGTASWYGYKFHGRTTSNGERYDMYAMSAAHKSLPLPTYATVTNLDNGRSVIVRINDRGPFHGNRLIDLSYTAAAKLGILGKGTGNVEVKAIDPRQPRPTTPRVATKKAPIKPKQASLSGPFGSKTTPTKIHPPPTQAKVTVQQPAKQPPKKIAEPGLFLQIGAFGNRLNAEQLRQKIRVSVPQNIRIRPGSAASRVVYRVQVGPLVSVQKAELLSQRLSGLGIKNTRLILE